MSETKNDAPQSTEVPASPFAAALAKTGLPSSATDFMLEKFDAAYNLTVENNLRIARINQAKSQDPNNLEYIDSLWAANQENDPAITDAEAKYQLAIAEAERLLVILREAARKQIKPPLSEEELAKEKELATKAIPTIEAARASAQVVAEMANKIMGDKAPEGGIWSLMPDADSLKNRRGRKSTSASSDGTVYATRANEILLNGKSTQRMVRGKVRATFEFAADELSKMFDAVKFQQNRVTPEELERELYKSLNLTFRDKDSLPDVHEFDFTKDVHKQNPQGEGTIVAPETVKVNWTKWSQPKSDDADKPEDKSNDTPANDKPVEDKKPEGEIVKDENNSPVIRTSAAKKTAAPKK